MTPDQRDNARRNWLQVALVWGYTGAIWVGVSALVSVSMCAAP